MFLNFLKILLKSRFSIIANFSSNLYPILGEYLEASETIKRACGGAYPEFGLNLSPVDAKGQATYTPRMLFIVVWNSVADNTKLFSTKEI